MASGMRFVLRMNLAKSPPAQYSMTRNILPFSCRHTRQLCSKVTRIIRNSASKVDDRTQAQDGLSVKFEVAHMYDQLPSSKIGSTGPKAVL